MPSPTAIESKSVLLVEVWDRDGKTLAYLDSSAGQRIRRVLVFHWLPKNLQEQIVNKDLPIVAQAIGDTFTATVMKVAQITSAPPAAGAQEGDLARSSDSAEFWRLGHEVDERILCRCSNGGVSRRRPAIARSWRICRGPSALVGTLGIGGKLPGHDLSALPGHAS
jgi:hypothetical protein